MSFKPTVVFDFDGVIHSYISGWKGESVIPDPPVQGIKEALEEIIKEFVVVIVSSRSKTQEGVAAMQEWLFRHEIPFSEIRADKPAAIVYIDDRGICFDGDSSTLLSKIKAFKPWYK